MTMGLAQRLREGTWALHSQTEQAGVMPALLRGTLPAAVFHRLQRCLHLLYAALEPALAAQALHPVLAPLQLQSLARCQALADDLVLLHGSDWAGALVPAPAALAYAQRLQGLALTQPALLAAHAYVRYLGDLSGGQALRRVIHRAYGLVGEAGTRFYDFGPPEQVAARVRQFRSALDGLPVDEALAEALVQEARWAFGQHARLFDELQAGLAPAVR